MPLTISFRETVGAQACRDVKFRKALLAEAMQVLLDGNLEEGAPLRVPASLGRSPKSPMRMLRPSGNPTADAAQLMPLPSKAARVRFVCVDAVYASLPTGRLAAAH